MNMNMRRMASFVMIAVALTVCGCDCQQDKLYYRQSIPESLTTSDRMEIQRTLESNGWTNVRFGWDFGDVVVAEKEARNDM